MKNILLFFIASFICVKVAAQQPGKAPESYRIFIEVENLLNAGKLKEAKDYIKHFPKVSVLFPGSLEKIDQLININNEAEKLLKNKNPRSSIQAIDTLKKYRTLKILNNPRIDFFERKIDNILEKSRSIDAQKLISQEGIILAFEHTDKGLSALANNLNIVEARRHFERADKLGGTGNPTLKKQIEVGFAAIRLLEQIKNLNRTELSTSALRDELEKYRSLPGIPVILPIESEIRLLSLEIKKGEDSLLILFDKCQIDLISTLNYLPESIKIQIAEIDNAQKKSEIYSNLEVKSTQQLIQLDSIINSAYTSQLRLTRELPEKYRKSLERCIREKKADALASLGKKASDLVQPVYSSNLFQAASNATTNNDKKRYFGELAEKEKEKSRCSLEQFENKIEEINVHIRQCNIEMAQKLWAQIEQLPSDCQIKVGHVHKDIGEKIKKISTNHQTLNKLITELKKDSKKMSAQKRAEICKQIQGLEVCDPNLKNTPQLRQLCSPPTSMIALGIEGGTMAPYGVRVEVEGRKNIGAFVNFRSSVVKSPDIISGKKAENKNEGIVGIHWKFTPQGKLLLNIGAGGGYYKLLYRNDYEGKLTTQRNLYAAAYGGATLRLGHLVRLSLGASFMNEGDGFYYPEYTCGLTFRITEK